MKLKINKACDLSSISVLPPRSKGMSFGADGSGLGRSQGSQHRSQSQQSFSQGPSLSQLSQSSLEESLMIDQRFGSQEKDNSSKRISFAPNKSARGESQLQLSRASNNVLRHWNSCSVPDNRCQTSDELEHSIRLMEGSINRLGMVLDSVQGDVMQVNRAVKEVSLEMEGIRQKIFVLDNSVQQMLKREDDIKAFLDESLKSISDKVVKTSSSDKLNEIASAFSAVPEKIEAHLLKLQEVCRVFTSEMEVIVSGRKPSNNKCADSIQSMVKMIKMDPKQSLKSHMPLVELPNVPLLGDKKRIPVSRVEEEKSRALEPKLTDSKHHMARKQEAIPPRMQEKDFRVVIDLDEDNDGVGSYFLVKKETGKESDLMDEAREETMRILRKARKRRRRLMNPIIVI